MILVNTLILLASPLFTLFLFAYVFGQRRKNRLNFAFLTLIATYFIDSMCDFSFRVLDSVILRQFFLAVATSLFFGSGFAFLNFIYAFINKKADFVYKLFGILGIICAISPLVNITLHSTISGSPGEIYTPLPNTFFAIVLVLYICPIILYGCTLMIRRAFVSPDPAEKKRMFIWISGIVIALFYVILICFILPKLFHITIFSTFSSLSLIIIDIFTYWLVRRHNFLTVNINQIEEILEKVFSGAGEAIMLIDRSLHIVRANNAAISFFNLDPQSIGRILLSSIIPDLIINHENNTLETSITVSGEQRSTLINVTALHAADETVHKVITVRDITRIKQAEEEIFRKQQLESLGLLAGGIAHDFNNLLCGVVSSFSFAKMNIDPDSETGRMLTEGEKAALSARSLTQQLLTFAKGGAPVTTVFNPIEVLRDASTFSTRGGKARIEFELPDESIRILADEGQIRQVFQNIVINASQAMPDGGLIKIRGKNISVLKEQIPPLVAGQYLEIIFTDQGCGISPQILPRIFDPYFSTKNGGNGIGLAIVYRILARHHGHITVASEVGKGTTFTIYLPVLTGDSKPVQQTSQNTEAASGRVLIMDDDPIIRLTLATLLQKLGYTVDATKNGEEALEKFDHTVNSGESYKFIITDLTVIGGMGGKELAREIALRNPSIPIIISSGYSDDIGQNPVKDTSATAFLRKPYNLRELKAALEIIAC